MSQKPVIISGAPFTKRNLPHGVSASVAIYLRSVEKGICATTLHLLLSAI